MGRKSHYLLALASAAMLTTSAAPALADDDPIPSDPPICLNDDGTPTYNEGCPPENPNRQATGH